MPVTVSGRAAFAMPHPPVRDDLVIARSFCASLLPMPLLQLFRVLRYHYDIDSSAIPLRGRFISIYYKRSPFCHTKGTFGGQLTKVFGVRRISHRSLVIDDFPVLRVLIRYYFDKET